MMPARLLLACGLVLAAGLAPAAFGQLQLFVVESGQERPAGASVDAGQVAPGDTRVLRFRIRNAGSAAAVVQTIGVSGSGFRISNRPPLPYTLAAAATVDFEIGFQPTAPGNFSATAAVNGISLLLRGTSAPAALVMTDRNGSLAPLTTSDTVDFGRTQRGTTATRTIVLGNSHTAAVTVGTLTVAGTGFRLAQAVTTPIALEPGENRRIEILFEPGTSGAKTGTLQVDQRSFRLAGTAFDPPMPPLSITLDQPASGSAQQRRISLRLPSPAPASAAGNLRLDFQSDVASVSDDPAVRFVASGSRFASFTIREGDTQARFGADSDVAIQTGTTAGKILLTVELGPANSNQPPDLTIAIPRSAVSIESATFTRRLSDLDVQVTGFDNSYEAGLLAFTFFDSGGRAVDPGVIRVDARPEFQTFFRSARAGSAFVVRASFPVIGDASGIAGVEVEFTNAAGSSRTQRIAIR